jgi:hypothetical protein
MVMESEKLQAALAKVRTSILLDYGELFGSEERCRQRVIDPILSALGWDIFSDEVVVEHPLPSSGKGAPPALDYVLYEVLPWGKLPRVVIEAKAIRELQKEIRRLLESKGQKAVDILRSKRKEVPDNTAGKGQKEEVPDNTAGKGQKEEVPDNTAGKGQKEEVPDNTAGKGQKGSEYGSLLALLDVQCWFKDKGQPQGGEKPSQNQGQASKETSCPNFNLAQTGIPVYEVGRYVMPSRIIITSGVDWIFMDLEVRDYELFVSHVESLHILREPLSRTIEVLSRFLSPEAIIGKEEIIWPRCAPVPLRMVVFNPQLQRVFRGRGGNICLYHWESVNDPPALITDEGPITLGDAIDKFKGWLESKFPGSKIPYVPKPNPPTAYRVFAGLYEMVIEYWRRFPFNGVTPDTIGVYSNVWGEKTPSCATSQLHPGHPGQDPAPNEVVD